MHLDLIALRARPRGELSAPYLTIGEQSGGLVPEGHVGCGAGPVGVGAGVGAGDLRLLGVREAANAPAPATTAPAAAYFENSRRFMLTAS